jgi:hypothetical protein
MNSIRNPFPWLAVAVISLLALTVTPGCRNPEQVMLATAQAQHLTAKSALARWNDYLGAERVRMAVMTPEAAAARTAEIQKLERKVVSALEEYNRAVLVARINVDAYFDIKESLARTNAPPGTSATAARVTAYLDAITAAENALINLITTYAK